MREGNGLPRPAPSNSRPAFPVEPVRLPGIAAASCSSLVAALNADIVQEWAAADRYLRLARSIERSRHPGVCRQIAVCAAAPLSHATALAAELMALGGLPPSLPAPKASPPATSLAEHLIDARADLAHYQDRLAFARRLGLLRLQEVFREIVRSKKRHLAHARIMASAYMTRRVTKTKRETS